MPDVPVTQIASDAAHAFGILPDLVWAIIDVESDFRTKVARYEKGFSYLYMPEQFARAQKFSEDTERQLQKFSWGPMQLMGATARWLGFTGFLPDLCDVKVGTEWGCRYLHNLTREYSGMEDQIAAYNAGSAKKLPSGLYINQSYVNKVLTAMGLPDKKSHLMLI